MKTQQTFSSILPPNFAQEVLDLEGELTLSCKREVVHRLLQLYTMAVEHYEALSDCKHLHYQGRLHALLAKPEVLASLNCPVQPRRTELGRGGILACRSAQKELDDHKLRSSSTSRRAARNLQRQSTGLNKRLKKRQQRLTRQLLEDPCLNMYEQKVEQVMEWFAQQKQRVVRQIEDDYQRELEELSKLESSSLLDSVIDAVKVRMHQAIDRACSTLEAKKRVKVQAARVNSLRD